MNTKVLTGRRKVHPLESRPCSVHGKALSFRMLGLPYLEPGFATLEDAPQGGGRWECEAHGVAHLLRPEDWQRVMRTEGVVPGATTGYAVVEVQAQLYDGRIVCALTLQGRPASLHPHWRNVLPSRRYMDLLRQGAAQHGVLPAWREHLQQLGQYESAQGSLAARAGLMATAAMALPLMAPLAACGLAAKALAGAGGSGDEQAAAGSVAGRAAAGYMQASMATPWLLHDWLLQPVFGSGCTNDAVSTSTTGSSRAK